MFSRTAIVALVVVVAFFGGLYVFSTLVIPLLPRNGGDEGQRLQSSSAPARESPKPTAAPVPTPSATTVPPELPPATRRPIWASEFYTLKNARVLEQHNRPAAWAIRDLPWIDDGIDDSEREAAESLVYLAATQDELFDDLSEKPWIDVSDISRGAPTIVALSYLAEEDPEAAQRLPNMPFLDTLEPADPLAVESLSYLAFQDLPVFRRVMRHPAVLDGIDDAEARVIALLEGAAQVDPSLVGVLLDPSRTHTEQRTINLPLSGPVTLAITRTSPGAARSMDLLEEAVKTSETVINRPFPAEYVALLFENAVPGNFGGTHNGLNLTIIPDYDVDDGSYEAAAAGRVIAHEVAHYYWRHSEPWLDEGAAEFTAAMVEHIRTGAPLEPVNYPCPSSATISQLERQGLQESDAGYACNYAIGERLFLDLDRSPGRSPFLEGFRRLYDIVSDVDISQESQLAGIDELRQAFAGTAEASAINRWYTGQGTGSTYGPDNRPVVAELPEVNGWINRAYISLEEEGEPVRSFAAAEAGDWVWLTLDYSHDYAGPPTELTFEVVEYYQDGFPYRRDTLTIEASRLYSGGVQLLSVGPGPGQGWATGRHWIYVLHEGRKVAQAEFEVTP